MAERNGDLSEICDSMIFKHEIRWGFIRFNSICLAVIYLDVTFNFVRFSF